jgi:hypothetical protein
MAKATDRFREFARLGAQVRLQQLREETRAIYKAFPGLRFAKRNATGNGVTTVAAAGATSVATSRPRRKRRKLTAAEKKRSMNAEALGEAQGRGARRQALSGRKQPG